MPETLTFLLSGVIDPLVTYRFYVTAVNFNGEGIASGTALLRSCTYPSAGLTLFAAPVVRSVNSFAIAISWTAP